MNAAVSVAAIILCLGFAELFFQLNAKYKWLRPRQVRSTPMHFDSIPAEPIPAAILADINARFPPAGYNKAAYEFIESVKHEKVHVPTPGYSYIPQVIAQKRSSHSAISVRDIFKVRDQIIFDAVYSLDENHVRRSSAAPYDGKKKNVLLLGCSYPFGVGVNDDETLTGFLAKDLKNFNYYNLGVASGGLSNALDDIYFKDRLGGLNKNGGVVIYHYWYDQFARYFASSETVREWDPAPHQQYRIEDGKLLPSADFDERSAIKAFFLRMLDKSELLYFSGLTQQFYSLDNQKQFLQLLQYIRDFYKSEYNLDFYVLVMNPESIPSRYFLDQLQERDMKYILYKSMNDYFPPHEIIIAGDGHFNPKGNYAFSRLVKAKLKEDGFSGF
jgi:hypothetical protein